MGRRMQRSGAPVMRATSSQNISLVTTIIVVQPSLSYNTLYKSVVKQPRSLNTMICLRLRAGLHFRQGEQQTILNLILLLHVIGYRHTWMTTVIKEGQGFALLSVCRWAPVQFTNSPAACCVLQKWDKVVCKNDRERVRCSCSSFGLKALHPSDDPSFDL